MLCSERGLVNVGGVFFQERDFSRNIIDVLLVAVEGTSFLPHDVKFC